MIEDKTRTLTLSALMIALVFLTFGLTVSADEKCIRERVTLQLPDMDGAGLRDGQHVIAATETKFGKLEARVNIKGKAVSEPNFYLGEKPLKPTAENDLPKGARICLKKAATSAPPGLTKIVYSKGRTVVFSVVWSHCDEGGCTYVVECNEGGRWCGYYVV